MHGIGARPVGYIGVIDRGYIVRGYIYRGYIGVIDRGSASYAYSIPAIAGMSGSAAQASIRNRSVLSTSSHCTRGMKTIDSKLEVSLW
jgi:hypothetical protein